MKRTLRQTAVYWEPIGDDGFGKISLEDAIDISVRWEQKSRLLTDNKGKEMTSDAEVYSLIDLEVDGRLWLGSVEDSSYTTDDEMAKSAYVIKAVQKVPSMRSGEFVRTSYLGKGSI